jgi:hypothetical protein
MILVIFFQQTPPPSFWNGPAANWAVAFGTLALAIVAVSHEWIQSWFVKPDLVLDVHLRRPDAEKTMMGPHTQAYYFRLTVSNTGSKAAEDVQVYAFSVKRKNAGGQYETVERFLPMALRWTHKGISTLPYILPEMPPSFCDLGHVIDPTRKVAMGEHIESVPDNGTVFALETEVKPNSKGNLLAPGEYRLHLKVAASNFPPRDYVVKLKLRGEWFEDEDRMFTDGIGLTLGR